MAHPVHKHNSWDRRRSLAAPHSSNLFNWLFFFRSNSIPSIVFCDHQSLSLHLEYSWTYQSLDIFFLVYKCFSFFSISFDCSTDFPSWAGCAVVEDLYLVHYPYLAKKTNNKYKKKQTKIRKIKKKFFFTFSNICYFQL